MGYNGNNGMTWRELWEANKARIPFYRNRRGETAHSKPDGSDWTPAQWLQAVVGELGEYANLRKKYERGEINEEVFMREAGYELADTATYLSILAHQIGVDMDAAIRDKFNIVSDRVCAPIYIGDDWEWHNRLNHGNYTVPVPEYGDLIPVAVFKECCKTGAFVDYDGHGYPCRYGLQDERCQIRPSRVENIPADATHICWYNR